MNDTFSSGVKSPLIILALIVAAGLLVLFSGGGTGEVEEDTFTSSNETTMTEFILTSDAFEDGASIPEMYTCDGENVNPPLVISGTPEDAKSLALIVDDPDVPQEVREDGMFVHWVLFDIPPEAREIPENSALGTVGSNGAGNTGYTGPCPPTEYAPTEHRYFFKLYALDTLLHLSEGSTKAEVEEMMKGHVIQSAELMGLYDRAE